MVNMIMPCVSLFKCILAVNISKKVQVGNDQEKRNQKKSPTPDTEAGKLKLTVRYLYHEYIS